MKRLQLNSPELYNVWKGQLYIQEHLACNIKFKSSCTCSIPAQLPSKLEIKEAIRLSELRKALPAQFFDQINITGREECYESVYSTLYAVKTSNVHGFEFDKLLEWMKDHQLALIKVLNDQGFLILLTSSTLQCCKDPRVRDPFQLFALFLFPYTKLLDNTAVGREDKWEKEDTSLEITELLPGLQYAILETRQMPRGKGRYPNALVEEHFKHFSGLPRSHVGVGEVSAEPSRPSRLSSGHEDIPDQCDQSVFSCLRSYFSSPVNFSVPVAKMSGLLKEDAPLPSDSEKCGKNLSAKDSAALESKIPLLAANKMKGDGASNGVLNENKKQPAKKRTFKKGGRRGPRKGRRKHTHQAAMSAGPASENQVASKKRKLTGEVQPPPPTPPAVSSNRTTVKLASAPNTHRRKRGAEVLTAEFVNYDKVSETETTASDKKDKPNVVLKNKVTAGKPRKASSAEETPPAVRERPPKRKASDPGNKNKAPEVKAKPAMIKGAIKRQEQSGKQLRKSAASVSVGPSEPSVSFSKSSAPHRSPAKQAAHPSPAPEKEIMEKRINMYESHALNLLADLALNSLSSSSISYINSESAESEPAAQEKVPAGDSGNAVDDSQNDCDPPTQANASPEELAQAPDGVKSQPKVASDAGQANSATPHRADNGEKQTSHKMLIAAAKAKARNNTTSKISLEHSYSQLPREDGLDKSSKEGNEKPVQGAAEPPPASPDNEMAVDQSADLLFIKEHPLVIGDNGCPSLDNEPREVSKFRDNFVITFKWEPKYNFDLDSKFTSDPLEKTINRALHGPWNTHLKEKVEDVKIILHMWLALFYSKPSQQVTSSSRKVVEHSNPAKYVSINTVHDPLYEGAETDAADSDYGNDSGPTGPQTIAGDSPVWRQKEDRSSSQPMDLSVSPRIQTKDYNISEIFQMFNQSSVSALYTNSLQTTVMCKMTSASKVAPPPSYYIDQIPTLCYTGDRKQLNPELTAKSGTCVAISGGPSGKVNPGESEHKYSKHFSSAGEAQRSSGSEKSFSTLHEDFCSTDEESPENYMPVSPEPESPTSFEDMLPLIGGESQSATGRSGVQPLEKIASSNVDDTKSSLSVAISVNRAADVLHDDDGLSDHSHPEKRSPLVSWKQIIRAKYKQQETVLASNEGRDVLEAKLQDGSMDSPVGQSNEDQGLGASNVRLDFSRRSNGCALGDGERIDYNINDLKSSRFGENKTNEKLINNENLSLLARLNDGSHTASLEVGKPSESGIRGDNLPTLESPKAARISLRLAQSQKSTLQGESQGQAASNEDLPAESNAELSSTTGMELRDGRDPGVDLALAADRLREAISSTNEGISGKRSQQSSDELEEHQKGNSDACEVPKMWTTRSGYSRENEHSYVSKIAPFGKMGKLQLSSSETSDVEDMDTDPAGKSDPRSPEKSDREKSHGHENLDLVDPSAADFHQDGGRDAQDTDHSTEVNGSVKTKERLPAHSQSPSPACVLGADQVASLPAASADFQAKDTDVVGGHFFQSVEVEDISDADERDDTSDNTQTFGDQGVRPLIRSEISGKDAHFGEKSSLLGLESGKAADLESQGEKTLLIRLESGKTADLERKGEKSSLLGSESSKAADLEGVEKLSLLGSKADKAADLESQGEKSSLPDSESSKATNLEKSPLPRSESSKAAGLESQAEQSPLLGSESSKAADLESSESSEAYDDLECISVFEKLSLKAEKEMYTTRIPTLAKKQELQISDVEGVPSEKEAMDNNPPGDPLSEQTDLCGSSVLVIEDHMSPNTTEEGDSCEMLQAPTSSEALSKATSALVEKSKPHDPDDAANQPASRCVNRIVIQLSDEPQSDSTSDELSVTLSPVQPKKHAKDQTQSMRNTIRKEILSKLKRICRGTGTGQHAGSNSEDEVVFVLEKPGNGHTGEQTKPTDNIAEDLAKSAKLAEESVNETQEDQIAESEIIEEIVVEEMAEDNPLTEPEAEQLVSPDKRTSPVRDDLTDHMEQDSGQDQSEICCILNTSSISKEQYDRWPESSDDDIEFVRSYKEPLPHKTSKCVQKEQLTSSPMEEPTSHPEPSHSRKAKRPKRHRGISMPQREAGDYASRYHRDPDYPNPRGHGSFTITKKIKDVGRTWPTSHKERFSAARPDLDAVFTSRRVVSSDLTQNTLDMERLRFMCRLKDVLRKSAADVHVSETPFQTMFDSRRIPGCSRSRSKGVSPLLITVQCKHRRRDPRGPDGSFPSTSYSQAYYEGEPREKPAYYSRTAKKVRKRRRSPHYHFSRLRYESAQEKSNSDISGIIKECTQSNHLKLSHVSLGGSAAACAVPEESERQIRRTFDPASTKSKTVGNIITDLCTNLRNKLHSVARESAQRNCYFYLSKTIDDQEDEDDDFFSLTKALLIKDGYTPIEPQDFCDSEQAESNRLLVILRNENVSSQIHKIPRLLQLRLLPSVRFAGVDTPEDLSESIHQDLLQTGGFVVSDKAVLENITLAKLKEVLTALEKMNRSSSWKWLIHYGDYRKLKEDKRTESASRIKIPLLKSYQQMNVIEILPYHRCDSRAKDLSSDLECLLSLQSQHIRSRLAVWLTVMPSTEAEEMEQNGILVYDVDTFIKRIQKVDAQLQQPCWS
ncbi:LOW QUALITY PROTEIN: protein TASOR 2 [Mantella aurantiaca]